MDTIAPAATRKMKMKVPTTGHVVRQADMACVTHVTAAALFKCANYMHGEEVTFDKNEVVWNRPGAYSTRRAYRTASKLTPRSLSRWLARAPVDWHLGN